MKLFRKEEVNTGRQFEFDLAKAVCILGMVFVHCFEMLALDSISADSSAYYVMVIVLDAIFGAGTFMACMGLGIAYSWKNNADKLIKRGIRIFLLGYLLNILRDGIPYLICYFFGKADVDEIIIETLCLDIMPFAGLALMLFGLLKKLRLSDLWVFVIALVMSVVGSFVRFLDLGHYVVNELAGLFIGTFDPINEDALAAFPLLNWFIIVVMGYLYAQLLRRCSNKEKLYAFTIPVTGVILAVYMLIAIPNRSGMMCGDLMYYYHMTTLDAFILLSGAVFITGVYYFVSKLFSERIKHVITRMSVNINSVYCIHWVIIGWINFVFIMTGFDGLDDLAVFLVGLAVFTAATVLAEGYKRIGKKEKSKV